MLKSLSVQNFALIDELVIELDKGLTVITGETGAGKSILLGALRLILGQRADHSSLKNQDQKCIVEGEFDIKNYQLQSFFEDNELDYWEECILRREISPQGKSRNFINDTPTTLDVMKRLGARLIDLHSQHQSLQINDADFQLQVLDALADNQSIKAEFKSEFGLFQNLTKELEELKQKSAEAQQEQDFVQFQFDELEALNYQEGEGEELEEEQELLANSEEILQNYNLLQQLLSDDEQNVIDQLKQAQKLITDTAKYFSSVSELSERMQSALIEVEDITQELAIKMDGFEFDPQRQEWVEERMAEIHRLQKKHQLENADELVAIKDQLDSKLADIGNYEAQVDETEKKLKDSTNKLNFIGEKLSQSRVAKIELIEKSVEERLKKLGIPNAVLKIEHQQLEQATSNGFDVFEFTFSANKGMAPQKLANTASGGEISRLVLAVKALLANHRQMPTILFDEIDTGVSGEVADQMGEVLQQIAAKRQVVSITHLPQIAAKGNAHFFVYKEDKLDRAQSQIKKLSQEDRVVEIAKMLSGKNTTEAALNNARELLTQ